MNLVSMFYKIIKNAYVYKHFNNSDSLALDKKLFYTLPETNCNISHGILNPTFTAPQISTMKTQKPSAQMGMRSVLSSSIISEQRFECCFCIGNLRRGRVTLRASLHAVPVSTVVTVDRAIPDRIDTRERVVVCTVRQ